ncbi:MAG: hypothetical protein E7675_06935 [Ruminococcaceae bacterium]|nr:hypothetical protein [Oscillospiraceae bacterium]
MKKILSMTLVMAMLLSTFCIFTVNAETEIVKDGLVAWYDGKNNTENGHDADSLVWYDLAGDNDVKVVKNSKNYFTDDAYHLNSTQHNFPSKILETINGKEFTVELKLGDVKRIGGSFATFINCTNDNFSLFLRNSGDYVEFKCASNARPKVSGGLEYVKDSTLTITYKVGGKCCMYVDGILIASTNPSTAIGGTAPMFFGHAESIKTHEADYKGMRFYSKALSQEEVVQNATADGTYDPSNVKPSFFDIEQPSTNMFGDLTLCEFVTTAAKLNAFKGAEYLPADAVIYINESLKATDAEGKNEFATIDEVFTALDGKIIPVFYIKDTKTADALIKYLKEKKLEDITVISDDKTVVKYAREAYTVLRGIIDYTEALDGKTLTQADLLEIRAENTKHLAKTALLPASVATEENVKYLNSRQITTWVNATEKLTEKEALDLIFSQAYGIAYSDSKFVYDVAMKYITEKSLIRTPGIIGHRGIPSTHPENTLEGAIAAYEAGADIIEIDIYLTLDNVIVINHDSRTNLYNKKLAVETSTLAILKQLDYNGCKIPTLEEFFKEFKGKDVLIFIEIKSQKPKIVTEMKSLIEEYDMYGQCAVITYESTGQLPYMKKYYPEMPVGGLSGLTNSGTQTTLPTINEFVGKYNTTFNPSYSGYDAEYIKESLARGITTWPYTINTPSVILQYITFGHAGITTNYANVTGNLIKDTTLKADKLTGIGVGEKIPLTIETVNFKRAEGKLDGAEFVFVEGSDVAKIENGELVFTKEGSASVFAKATKVINGYSYTVYSDIVTFTTEDSTVPPVTTETDDTVVPETTVPADTTEAPDVTPGVTPDATPDKTPEPTDDKTGGNGSGTIIIVVVVVVIVLAGAAVAFIVIKKKK